MADLKGPAHRVGISHSKWKPLRPYSGTWYEHAGRLKSLEL